MEKIRITFSIFAFLLLCFQRGNFSCSFEQFINIFHAIFNANVPISVKCSEDEERLVRDLFRGYNKLIRPVQNMTQKVDVRFGLAFVQLINVVRIIRKINFMNFFVFLNRETNELVPSPFLIERKKSNHEIERMVEIGME